MNLTGLWSRSKIVISIWIMLGMVIGSLISTSYKTLDVQSKKLPQQQTQHSNQTQLIVFNRYFEDRMLNKNDNSDNIILNEDDEDYNDEDYDDEDYNDEDYDDEDYNDEDYDDEDDDEDYGDENYEELDDTQYFVYSEETNNEDDDEDNDDTNKENKENLLGDINDNDVLFDVNDLDDLLGDSTSYNKNRKLDNILGDSGYDDIDDLDNSQDASLDDSSSYGDYSYENDDDFKVSDYPDDTDLEEFDDYDYLGSDTLDDSFTDDDQKYYDENESDDLNEKCNDDKQSDFEQSSNTKSRQKQLPIHPEKHKALQSFISKINSAQSTWTAGLNDHLKLETSDLKRLMACAHTNQKQHRNLPTLRHIVTSQHPSKFDARKRWPQCAGVINYIRNQHSCGSCWSESVAGTASDRICIQFDEKVRISAVDLQCCSTCFRQRYCSGGDTTKAWQYFASSGLVTGGDQTGGCKPWTMSLAKSHCSRNCTNDGYHTSYKDDLHFGTSVYQVGASEKQIMAEVRKHGSVSALMDVYSDFMAYKGGVYKPMSRKKMGRHAIRLIGWGQYNGEPYWLVANSWGRKWGISGFFMIARNDDPCNIMNYVTAGIPKSAEQKPHRKKSQRSLKRGRHDKKHKKHSKKHKKHDRNMKHGKRRKHRKHHK